MIAAVETSGDSLISLEEAGRMLGGVSAKTVRRRIAEGILPKGVKEGKFRRLFRSDIVALIEKLKRERDKEDGVHNPR
jgi:predicted DNA-binding transcriptional regulator AlpA